MKFRQTECPRTEQLSALIDDEHRRARGDQEPCRGHPLCGPMLRLTELRLAMRPPAEAALGIDILPLIDAAHRAPGARRRRGQAACLAAPALRAGCRSAHCGCISGRVAGGATVLRHG
jgi:hypothetical protein